MQTTGDKKVLRPGDLVVLDISGMRRTFDANWDLAPLWDTPMYDGSENKILNRSGWATPRWAFGYKDVAIIAALDKNWCFIIMSTGDVGWVRNTYIVSVKS